MTGIASFRLAQRHCIRLLHDWASIIPTGTTTLYQFIVWLG